MDDLLVVKRKLLVKYPFFGSVIAGVIYKEDETIPTACTDGEIIYYNPDYFSKINVDEKTFLFAHEISHIAFNHILRSEGKEQELWNIATDAVINQLLKRDGLPLIEDVIDMPEAINYDAEELYELLLKQKKQNEQQQDSESMEQQYGEDGNTSDNEQSNQKSSSNQNHQNKSYNHNMWEDAVKNKKEKHSNNENTFNKDNKKNSLEKKQEELESMGEKDAFKKNNEDKKKQLEELKESISKEASMAGSTTNSNSIKIYDIGRSKPLIDWRYALREATKFDVDWSYKNATIEDGVVTSRLEEQSIPETEIVIDTSGSVNSTLLKNFLRECKNILKYSKLKVGWFDTIFYGFKEIRTEEDIDNLNLVGDGGTDFDVAVNAFSNRVENKIIFTDGESSMPKKSLNVIWIVYGDKEIHPKGGKVINITGEQLKKLKSYDKNLSLKRTLK